MVIGMQGDQFNRIATIFIEIGEGKEMCYFSKCQKKENYAQQYLRTHAGT